MRKALPYILIALVVVLAGTSVYFYKASKGGTQDKTASQAEAKALAAKVGKLIVLPSDEVPTIATVSDPEKLKDQNFFADAKKGDKVLIYTNAKKAILYDPVANKVVTIAPINIAQTGLRPQSHKLLPTPQKPKIALIDKVEIDQKTWFSGRFLLYFSSKLWQKN
jgi:hypothetical protein